jgi:hypothetical protein
MPPGINLEASMRDLTDWISGRPQSEGIIAAAMAHYQFETLHPFNDGNGRLGRLLIVLQLCMMGDLREPLLSVSPWFEARREAYQEHLANVSKMGDWDSWIKFFATGVEESAIDVAQRVDRILDVQKAYQGIALAEKVSGLARDIIDFLPGFPVITAPYVTRTTGKTTQAAGLALKRLVGLGILKGPYGTYEKRYIATDIWAALGRPRSGARRSVGFDPIVNAQREATHTSQSRQPHQPGSRSVACGAGRRHGHALPNPRQKGMARPRDGVPTPGGRRARIVAGR